MAYTQQQAPANLDTDGVRRFTEEQLRQISRATAQMETDHTALATQVAALVTSVNTLTTNVSALQTVLTQLGTPLSNSLGADVLLNNTATFFTGPQVAQGTVGTWFVHASTVVFDSVTALMNLRLWDGTTTIDSAAEIVPSTETVRTLSLGGIIVNPAGNIRLSVKDATNTTGKILFNQSGLGKDSTLVAIRLA